MHITKGKHNPIKERSGGDHINWVSKLSITNIGTTWHCVPLDMMQNKAHSITFPKCLL